MEKNGEVKKCYRCGNYFSGDRYSEYCPSCSKIREENRDRARNDLKRRMKGETMWCSYCNRKGVIHGIKCPRCDGNGEIPINISPGEFLVKDLPSDHDRI